MITEVCAYLKNWFDRERPKFYSEFIIENGEISLANGEDMGIAVNQYYRIIGSTFNDGVHKYGDATDVLEDERFVGAVWLMAVPKDVITLCADIQAWQNKYGSADSVNMSPFTSESFGGYSYSKGSTSSDSKTISAVPTWESTFASRLARYKKI